MKLQRQRKRAGWIRAAVVFLPLLLYMVIFSPVAQAINFECAAGRHQYAETQRVPATTMKDGEVHYICTLCGQQYTEILYATDHIWGPWITDKSPTCTEPGEKHHTCTRGLSHDEYAEIPALGHDYAESVTTQPGCESEGVKTYTCSHCGDAFTESIPVTGHEYMEETIKQPSCFEDGLKSFICVHDPAHTYTEEIPAFGSHSFGKWYVETPAEEGVPGMEARICSRDGLKETREIPELPVPEHPYNAGDIILISADIAILGGYSIVIIRYARCLQYIKKRRKTIQRVKGLREMVENFYDFK